MKNNKILKKISLKLILSLIGICIIYGVLFFIYYRQFTSFIFFDEVANIVAGHFLLQGYTIYSEQFFNHQMLPVYISALIQGILSPDSLYQLIMYHRIFIFVASTIAGVFLIYRLRWVGVGVILVYELLKYYLFGYLFLAEALIVYIHIYLFYLGWKRVTRDKIASLDLILATLGTWFIVWSREPYVPLAVILFGIIIVSRTMTKARLVSIGIFLLLSIITFLTVPIKEYLYQVVYVNYETVFSYQLESNTRTNLGLFSLFFYPLFVFFSGEENFFRLVLVGLSSTFLAALGYYLHQTKKWKLALYIIVILALANVRMVQPGTMYYSAFYQIQWLGLIITAIFLLLNELYSVNKKLTVALLVLIGASVGYSVVQSDSYITRTIDRHALFAFQYDKYLVTGKTIDVLASEGDTVLAEFSESLLYWQTKTPPAFSYKVYYPVMQDIEKYRAQRLEMFINTPPTFYYFNCMEGRGAFNALPQLVRHAYAPIRYPDEVNCLYVLKEKARTLSNQQLSDIQKYGYRLDPSALD